MKTFLSILLFLFLSPFVIAAAVIMIAAIFKMIMAGFMFVIPAAFILVLLYIIGVIWEPDCEQAEMDRTSRND